MLYDKISLENIVIASKPVNNLTPSAFNIWFGFSSDQLNYYETSSYRQGNHIKSIEQIGMGSIQ